MAVGAVLLVVTLDRQRASRDGWCGRSAGSRMTAADRSLRVRRRPAAPTARQLRGRAHVADDSCGAVS